MPKLGDIIQRNKCQNYNDYDDYSKLIWSACSICGKERWVKLCNGKPRYNRCNSCAKSGKNNPRWKDGKSSKRRGIRIWQPEKKFFIFEHRLIMEKHLGRKLNIDEVVHHINGNKLDNRIENLMLFKNDSEHRAYHHKIGTYIGVYEGTHRRKIKIPNKKKYQAQYYKNNLERLKKYKKLQYKTKKMKIFDIV